MHPKLTALAVVTPVYKHAALGGFIEAANKVDSGALACAGLANQGYRLARLNVQIEVLQHLFAFLIGKAYVLEIDIALYGLPVFALGVEAVAVFGDYLGVSMSDTTRSALACALCISAKMPASC